MYIHIHVAKNNSLKIFETSVRNSSVILMLSPEDKILTFQFPLMQFLKFLNIKHFKSLPRCIERK